MSFTTVERLCACGVAFVTKRAFQQYCSRRCQIKQRRKRCIENGLCYSCSAPLTGKQMCDPCYNKNLALSAKSRQQFRKTVLEAYGGRCACCGESNFEFLAIDHIDGGGNEHRRSLSRSDADTIVRWLKRNNFPAGFQVLCHNCNMAKGFHGYCPHQRKN